MTYSFEWKLTWVSDPQYAPFAKSESPYDYVMVYHEVDDEYLLIGHNEDDEFGVIHRYGEDGWELKADFSRSDSGSRAKAIYNRVTRRIEYFFFEEDYIEARYIDGTGIHVLQTKGEAPGVTSDSNYFIVDYDSNRDRVVCVTRDGIWCLDEGGEWTVVLKQSPLLPTEHDDEHHGSVWLDKKNTLMFWFWLDDEENFDLAEEEDRLYCYLWDGKTIENVDVSCMGDASSGYGTEYFWITKKEHAPYFLSALGCYEYKESAWVNVEAPNHIPKRLSDFKAIYNESRQFFMFGPHQRNRMLCSTPAYLDKHGFEYAAKTLEKNILQNVVHNTDGPRNFIIQHDGALYAVAGRSNFCVMRYSDAEEKWSWVIKEDECKSFYYEANGKNWAIFQQAWSADTGIRALYSTGAIIEFSEGDLSVICSPNQYFGEWLWFSFCCSPDGETLFALGGEKNNRKTNQFLIYNNGTWNKIKSGVPKAYVSDDIEPVLHYDIATNSLYVFAATHLLCFSEDAWLDCTPQGYTDHSASDRKVIQDPITKQVLVFFHNSGKVFLWQPELWLELGVQTVASAASEFRETQFDRDYQYEVPPTRHYIFHPDGGRILSHDPEISPADYYVELRTILNDIDAKFPRNTGAHLAARTIPSNDLEGFTNEQLNSFAQTSFALSLKARKAPNSLSHVGGRPSIKLPEAWPTNTNGKPMGFLLQCELPSSDNNGVKGILVFWDIDDPDAISIPDSGYVMAVSEKDWVLSELGSLDIPTPCLPYFEIIVDAKHSFISLDRVNVGRALTDQERASVDEYNIKHAMPLNTFAGALSAEKWYPVDEQDGGEISLQLDFDFVEIDFHQTWENSGFAGVLSVQVFDKNDCYAVWE